MIKVGLIGCGYWGSNLLRNLLMNPAFEVVAIADANDTRRVKACPRHIPVKAVATAEAIIALAETDAVVIATPVATHYDIARSALQGGKHVLVEKPVCTSSDEARQLLQLANSLNRVLMVDHTFLFTSAVQNINTIIRRGDLGRIAYIDATRVNLGPFERGVNVLWDLGPHDLSIIDYILEEEPIHIEASGYRDGDSCQADMAYLTLHYPSGFVAHLNLGWLSPIKVRRFAIGGSAKTLVWNDLSSQEKLKIYTAGPKPRSQTDRNVLLAEHRSGDVFSPSISSTEALAGVVDHFANVIAGKTHSIMDGLSGLRVVRILEAAQKALDESLAHVGRLRASTVSAIDPISSTSKGHAVAVQYQGHKR
jgi:predicted dehydrogenase